MITFYLNGAEITLSDDFALSSALHTWGYTEGTVAVAVNEVFVPKKNYAKIMIQDGDRIDVVSAMQGG